MTSTAAAMRLQMGARRRLCPSPRAIRVPAPAFSSRTLRTAAPRATRPHPRSPTSAPFTPPSPHFPSQSRNFRPAPLLRAPADAPPDLEAEIGAITELYGEAKDELEYALEARGTTYYNSDKAAAGEAVEAVLSRYNQVLEALPEAQKADLQRRIGLKVLELRAQYDDMTKDDIEGDDH
ncbi:hypothetical protein DFJ74DRAFT_649835 [Hyaloraphidium curvatum]|nr:hypothetical protein DFJ74DRAFT_649835 [Hyaloraphidium curvatum]